MPESFSKVVSNFLTNKQIKINPKALRAAAVLPPGVFTGTDRPSPDLVSTANQVTVRFLTDSTGAARGFQANFTSGLNVGSPG